MKLPSKKKQKLQQDLLELALTRFDLFCEMTGADMVQAYICLEKKKGKSYGAIAQELGTTRSAVQSRCKTCKT